MAWPYLRHLEQIVDSKHEHGELLIEPFQTAALAWPNILIFSPLCSSTTASSHFCWKAKNVQGETLQRHEMNWTTMALITKIYTQNNMRIPVHPLCIHTSVIHRYASVCIRIHPYTIESNRMHLMHLSASVWMNLYGNSQYYGPIGNGHNMTHLHCQKTAFAKKQTKSEGKLGFPAMWFYRQTSNWLLILT